jgi:hypothetical protein
MRTFMWEFATLMVTALGFLIGALLLLSIVDAIFMCSPDLNCVGLALSTIVAVLYISIGIWGLVRLGVVKRGVWSWLDKFFDF